MAFVPAAETIWKAFTPTAVQPVAVVRYRKGYPVTNCVPALMPVLPAIPVVSEEKSSEKITSLCK
jgi:hypothetical protein